jgi:hypothetical protein
MLGATRDESSNVPARSKVVPAIDRGREKSVDPHFGQKVRSVGCPLAASLLNMLVGPEILTVLSGTATTVR